MRILIFIVLFAFLFSCDDEPKDCCVGPDPVAKELIKGADISFLPEIEAAGVDFKDATGTNKDLLDILKESGVNTIRVRLWHTPASGHSTLPEVKALSQRIKAKGMKVWLSVHYSDTWADPQNQLKPVAWEDASAANLADSVYLYTKKIMTEVDPDMIQLGNEILGGILWPEGSTGPEHLADFITYMKKGAQAVREVSSDTKIMIHTADFTEDVIWFYQQLKTNAVDYDLIGLSYYPIWHGDDLTLVTSTMEDLWQLTGKSVMIAETAYPFSLAWEDWTDNVVGTTNQLIPGYPATPDGQKKFLQKIRTLVTDSPAGVGFCYWGTEWISFKGDQAKDGSRWENQALFDFSNKALPALEAFADEE